MSISKKDFLNSLSGSFTIFPNGDTKMNSLQNTPTFSKNSIELLSDMNNSLNDKKVLKKLFHSLKNEIEYDTMNYDKIEYEDKIDENIFNIIEDKDLENIEDSSIVEEDIVDNVEDIEDIEEQVYYFLSEKIESLVIELETLLISKDPNYEDIEKTINELSYSIESGEKTQEEISINFKENFDKMFQDITNENLNTQVAQLNEEIKFLNTKFKELENKNKTTNTRKPTSLNSFRVFVGNFIPLVKKGTVPVTNRSYSRKSSSKYFNIIPENGYRKDRIRNYKSLGGNKDKDKKQNTNKISKRTTRQPFMDTGNKNLSTYPITEISYTSDVDKVTVNYTIQESLDVIKKGSTTLLYNDLSTLLYNGMMYAQKQNKDKQLELVNSGGVYFSSISGPTTMDLWTSLLIWTFSYISTGTFSILDSSFGIVFPKDDTLNSSNYMLEMDYINSINSVLNTDSVSEPYRNLSKKISYIGWSNSLHINESDEKK